MIFLEPYIRQRSVLPGWSRPRIDRSASCEEVYEKVFDSKSGKYSRTTLMKFSLGIILRKSKYLRYGTLTLPAMRR